MSIAGAPLPVHLHIAALSQTIAFEGLLAECRLCASAVPTALTIGHVILRYWTSSWLLGRVPVRHSSLPALPYLL